jgi:hypothetical protein
MEEEKLCGVCGKNAATGTCDGCGIPLCDACMRKVKLQTGSLTEQSVGVGITSGVSLSTLRPGVITKKLCEKCLLELDVEP